MLDLSAYLDEPPSIHEGGTTTVHHISRQTIDVINELSLNNMRTIETGVGFSTLIFTLNRCDHICIAPIQDEIDLLQRYFDKFYIDSSKTKFIVEKSEFVLPKLIQEKVDLAFIDGRHAFPTPFLDYYYLSLMLKVNGYLIIDDIHIWTGKILYDFLKHDSHWELYKNILGRTAVFKMTSSVDHSEWWGLQPYLLRKSKGSLWKSKIMQLGIALKSGDFGKITSKVKRTLDM
ncbi:MAG TPA: class I SAM-dependent methyltransferase [Balneolales bacterium]|nr:class I SAM-dependent methyltransferase [Balneolales bacterium]